MKTLFPICALSLLALTACPGPEKPTPTPVAPVAWNWSFQASSSTGHTDLSGWDANIQPNTNDAILLSHGAYVRMKEGMPAPSPEVYLSVVVEYRTETGCRACVLVFADTGQNPVALGLPPTNGPWGLGEKHSETIHLFGAGTVRMELRNDSASPLEVYNVGLTATP